MTTMLSTDDIVRAWTDPIYRSSLEEQKLSNIPLHPAGLTPNRRDISVFLSTDPVIVNQSPSIDCTNTSHCFTLDPCECEQRTACSAGSNCCL